MYDKTERQSSFATASACSFVVILHTLDHTSVQKQPSHCDGGRAYLRRSARPRYGVGQVGEFGSDRRDHRLNLNTSVPSDSDRERSAVVIGFTWDMHPERDVAL